MANPLTDIVETRTPQSLAADSLRIPMWVSVGGFTVLFGFAVMEIWVSFTAYFVPGKTLDMIIFFEELHPVLVLITGVAFLFWSYRAHSNLDVFERLDQTHSHKATIWWWIVPIAFLWMPFRVVFETVRGSSAPQGAADWKQEKLMPIAVWWTVFFLASSLALNASASILETAFTREAIETALTVNGLAFVVYGVGVVTAGALVWLVTRSQQELAASWIQVPVREAPPVVDAPSITPEHDSPVRFCSSCGRPFGEADTFCSSCGTPRPN